MGGVLGVLAILGVGGVMGMGGVVGVDGSGSPGIETGSGSSEVGFW